MTEATSMHTYMYFIKTLHFPNFLGSRCSYVTKFWPMRLKAQVRALQETSTPSSLHPWSLSSSFLPFLCSDAWSHHAHQSAGSHRDHKDRGHTLGKWKETRLLTNLHSHPQMFLLSSPNLLPVCFHSLQVQLYSPPRHRTAHNSGVIFSSLTSVIRQQILHHVFLIPSSLHALALSS